jgi:septin family protein
MVVIYDRYKTEELTDQDMVEAISARYGTASRPDATVILFSTFQVYDDSEKVIARWENAQYSFNLFRSSYQPTFGMLIFSKRLDILAQEAIAEAIRLDEQEDPQREIERQKIQGEANQAAQEKARLANKTNFRP